MFGLNRVEKAVLCAAFFICWPAVAEEDNGGAAFLDGPAIIALRNDVAVAGADENEKWYQTFSASGATQYTNSAGEKSKGAWGGSR